MQRFRNQVSLRSLILVLLSLRDLGKRRYDGVATPYPAWGPVPRPLLRFASILVSLYGFQIERSYA